jgi:DNA polymerase IV
MKDEQKRKIIHVDMDAFFAQIEQRDNPAYKNKPLIVGGPINRGVISTASYEARKYGLHSGMPLSRAKRLCPDGIYVPVDMEKYIQESRKIKKIFSDFTPLAESVGCDEAFLDVTGCENLFGSALEIAKKIKGRIYEETNLTSSAGIAPNKFLAKLASSINKPNGLTCLDDTEEVLAKVRLLPISYIWGVGRVTEEELARMGIKTIGDLADMPFALVRKKFGENGEIIHKMANGIDNRPVIASAEPKSVGRETTYEIDTDNLGTVKATLLSLSQRVSKNLMDIGYKAKTVTLKIRYSDFKTASARVTLKEHISSSFGIYRACVPLLDRFDIGKKKVRLVGISTSNLLSDAENECSLFKEENKQENLSKAMYEISKRFGDKKLAIAEGMERFDKKTGRD